MNYSVQASSKKSMNMDTLQQNHSPSLDGHKHAYNQRNSPIPLLNLFTAVDVHQQTPTTTPAPYAKSTQVDIVDGQRLKACLTAFQYVHL
jgi:hypothetical protein